MLVNWLGRSKPRDAEIHQLDRAVFAEPDVFGLDVAMHCLAMGKLKAAHNWACDGSDFGDGEPLGLPRRGARFPDAGCGL